MRQHILDDRIHRSAGRHEQHDRALFPKQRDELLDIHRGADVPVLGLPAQRGHLGGIIIIANHGMSVVGHVEHEIAPHDAQADHADFKLLCLPMGHGFVSRENCV